MVGSDILYLTIQGILLGGLYALIGYGLSVALGVMRIINVAHGDLAILAAYLTLALLKAVGLDPFLSIIIVGPLMFAIGFLFQKYLVNKTMPLGLNQVVVLTFATGIAIENALLLVFTPDAQSLTPSYMLGGITIGTFSLSKPLLTSFALALMIFSALHLFFKRTYVGKAMRAIPADLEAAQMLGVEPKTIYNFAMGLAMLVTAIAGVLLGMTFIFYPTSGPNYLMIAFGTVLIGGLGRMIGTVIGGFVMGLAMVFGGYFFGSHYQMMFCYIVILIIMLIRPQGIFKGITF